MKKNFHKLEMRQHKTAIPDRKEINKVSLMDCSPVLPGEFPGHREGRWPPHSLLELRNWNVKSGETKLKFSKQCTGEEKAELRDL